MTRALAPEIAPALGGRRTSSTGGMLGTRLAIGVPMVLLAAAVLGIDSYMAPWFPLWLATCLALAVVAGREVSGLLTGSGLKPIRPIVVGGLIAIVLANWLPRVVDHLEGVEPGAERAVSVLAWPMSAFTLVVMAAFVHEAVRFRVPGEAMLSVAGTLLGVAYVGVIGSFLVQFRWLDGPSWGLVPLAALVAAAKGSDTGAYTAGRLFGRRKLCPILSPNKTVAGAIGGLVASVLFSSLVLGIARVTFRQPTPNWIGIVVFGLAVGVAAQVGDLMESLIKRDCERKDASAIVPGFGGVLDVIDSLLFAAPVGYGVWLWLAE